MVGVFEEFYEEVAVSNFPIQSAIYNNGYASNYIETINSISEAGEALAELIAQDS